MLNRLSTIIHHGYPILRCNLPINEILRVKSRRERRKKRSPIKTDKDGYPEPPTTCCMSGCANCVWLAYAERLTEYYKDGGDKAMKEIEEKITDPNLKAFLLHEMRMRKKSQDQ